MAWPSSRNNHTVFLILLPLNSPKLTCSAVGRTTAAVEGRHRPSGGSGLEQRPGCHPRRRGRVDLLGPSDARARVGGGRWQDLSVVEVQWEIENLEYDL